MTRALHWTQRGDHWRARCGGHAIGVEIEERYFDIACRRIDDAQRQGDILLDAATAGIEA